MSQAGAAVLLVGVEPETEARLSESVRGLALAPVPVARQKVNEAVLGSAPVTALVSLERAPELDASCEAIARLASAGTRVVALGPKKDADLILRAMRAGAQEFVVVGDDQQLARALQRRKRPGAEGDGHIVTVFPARGGIGATAVAVNLAGALARSGERTCLVDLDLAFGDALAHLDLSPSYALSDVVANVHRLDRELLDASVARHESGLWVIGRGEKLDDAAPVHARDLATLPPFLRQHYRHIVVDGMGAFDELSLAALDASDRILLLVVQDVPAVRNAQRTVEVFKRLGYDVDKVEVVVNRFHKASKVSPEVLAESIGLPVRSTLANDYPALSQAIDRGMLLSESAPRSQLARDLDRLARSLRDPVASPRRRSFWSRMFSRKD